MNKIINWSIVQAVVFRHLFEWRRELDRIVDSFWWPMIDLIAWGLASKYIQENSIQQFNFTAFFMGGLIFWTFIQNAQRDINMPILSEAWNRNLINIFSTPLRLRELIVGTIILGLFKLSLTAVFLFLLAYFLYDFNIFIFGPFLLIAVVNLVLIGWWIGFIINGLLLRFGYRVQPFAWALVFVTYPFSAVLYPVSILPEWAQMISRLLPNSYIFENMRSFLFTGNISSESVLISILLNIFYLTLSLFFLSFMFNQARKKARLVKLN